MKLCLQLTSQVWVALKHALVRLNTELGQQGLAEQSLNAILATIEQDEQLIAPPLKLAVLVQALLCQAVTNTGCILGSVFLHALIVKDWIAMQQAEYQALQDIKTPLSFTAAQAELVKRLSIVNNKDTESLADIMSQLLCEDAMGSWTIDTLAVAKLQLRAQFPLKANAAKLNLMLLEILLLQQSARADWPTLAIKKLEQYAKTLETDSLSARQYAALVAYHLCGLYRLQLAQAKTLTRAQRISAENQWRHNCHVLQQLNVYSPLLTRVKQQLTVAKPQLRLYFYQQDNEAIDKLSKPVSTRNPYAGSLLWIIASGLASAGCGYLMWEVISAIVAMGLISTTVIPLLYAATLTSVVFGFFTLMLYCGVKEIQRNRKIKQRQAEQQVRIHHHLHSLETLMPLDVILSESSAEKQPAAIKVNDSAVTTRLRVDVSQALRDIGFYRSPAQPIGPASDSESLHHTVR